MNNGGHLILTCRTGQKDRNGQLHEALLQEPVYKLIGAKIEFNDQLPPGEKGEIVYAGKEYAWNNWGEVLLPDENTRVLASYNDQFYKGKAAITTRSVGKGKVSYIGVNSMDRELEKDVLRELYSAGERNLPDLPWYIFIEYRDGLYVAVNYSSEDYLLPEGDNHFILGGRNLMPGGVSVWKSKR